MNRIELLAPGGDPEKLETAIDYGADAVYCSIEGFGLRSSAGNFTADQLALGADYVHRQGKKIYLALNIIAHNEDICRLASLLKKLKGIHLDGFIVSDPGIIMLIKDNLPSARIHLSTQANTTNWRSTEFWHNQGVNRIILARELSVSEIKSIRDNTPSSLQLECFIHGSMCISYSGRCLLSNFMTKRDANRGECAHPCRYKYVLEEEKRPGEYYPIEEDDRGSYIMNSKDLCMIMHLPELINTGIDSLKIEGRTKSAYYTATVTSAYRNAIDEYYKNPSDYRPKREWLKELEKVSHRQFTTGFYFKNPKGEDHNYEDSQYIRQYTFIGVVKHYDEHSGLADIELRNKISLGDFIEIIGPDGVNFTQNVEILIDCCGLPLQQAPHPRQSVRVMMERPVGEKYMVRRKE